MSTSPIITFKAGQCDLDTSTTPARVKARPTPGYIYLFQEDELIHFCWRPRSAPLDSPELDLVMIPTDGTFTPYRPTSAENPSNPEKATNGRIYVLRFSSSSQRHLFWLQSQSQHPTAESAWFSARDLKLGQIVNELLQGEEVDVQQAIADIGEDEGPDGDEDEAMEDVEGTNHEEDHHTSASGGAGPGATGGDIREEGQDAREGGADGGRAAASGGLDANAIIQNFIKSMPGGQGSASGAQERLFTTLADLLTPASCVPFVDAADEATIDRLIQYLPPELLTLARRVEIASQGGDLSDDAMALDFGLDQKKDVLRRVVRSPQFSQSLSSLSIALRDGGLPSISEALNIPVRDGGYIQRGSVPMGGGDAVEAFLEGVKKTVMEG